MIQHFSFKPLYENTQLPGWTLSFFYKQRKYQAEYKKDGAIQYIGEPPAADELAQVEKMIHELILFHVYD
ncbi:YheE family protein [Lysinibacillus sp. 54212]|uniref:YheE family protein n=1 Tax=Lysinibacillus sp. 54212 TaxID=3119829 RepID=UPI002FC8BB9D